MAKKPQKPKRRAPKQPGRTTIAARRRAERRPTTGEEQLRELLENANDIIYTQDLNGSFTSVNKAAERLTGYTRDEALRMNMADIVVPEHREMARSYTLRKLAGEVIDTPYEVDIRTKSGKRLSVEVSTRLIRQDGKLVGVQGTARDITDRKRAEQDLRESESKFRAVTETAASAIFIMQRDRYVYVNPATEQISGYTRAELLAMPFWKLCAPDVREQVIQLAAARLRGDDVPARYELKIVRKDGQERWLDFTPIEIRFQGAPAILATGFDVTERKRAEEDLLIQKAYLEQLFDNAPEAIALLDTDRRVVRVNREFRRMFGFTASESVGRDIAMIVPEDRRAESIFILDTLSRGNPVNIETTRRRRDGSPVRVSMLATPISVGGGQIAMYLIFRDITEQKRAEEALRESESKFRAVAETAAIAIYIHDGVRFLYLNPASEQISGYSRAELFELGPWHMVHPEYMNLLRRRTLARQRGDDVPARYEFPIIAKSGETRWLDFSAGVIQFEGHQAILATAVDITKRKRAEALQAALYRIADTARQAGELGQLYSAIHRIVGELMYAENFYIALYDGETQLLSFPYFVDQEDPTPAPKPLGKGLTEYVLRTGEPLLATPERFDELVARGDAETIGAPSLDWLGVPLKRGDRAFGVLVVQTYEPNVRYGEKEKEILTFVSQHVAGAIEQKRSEDRLRESESRYRSLVQSAVYGIYRSSAIEDRFLDVNPALVSMLGYSSAEELVALKLSRDVYWEPEERFRQVDFYRKKERTEGVQVRWKRKDGSPITVRLSGRTVRDSRGEALAFEMIAEDITERAALELQLLQSQKMEAVGRLAGGVAHDFNNLLTVIKGYGELMLEELKPNDPMRSEVEEIQKAADRAASLTRQLLAFSRRQVLAPKIIALNSVVANMDKLLRRLLGEDIEFHTVLDPKLGRVKADPGQVEQVIMNLAVNARDAMPSGGKLTIETANLDLDTFYAREHVTVAAGPYAMLAVSDTGAGMDSETQSHIFEPFFTTKEMGKGTGLGLSTVYGIVKQSGGYIWVYSELGRGTTFKVYLPRVAEEAETAGAGGPEHETHRGSETILLVEDEDGVRALIRQVLTRNGYRVLEARHGEEAVMLAEGHKHPIHLLLTDVVLAKMSGRELAQRLAPQRAEMQVIYMSGYTDEAILHHGMLTPGTKFLQKPFTTDTLMHTVRGVLDSAKAKAAPTGN
ncbi:MAG: PAS domain S-box protein [Acidobacteriia bacterium]|nr:PAS domain S-box protein [Terriglobia bacterium]